MARARSGRAVMAWAAGLLALALAATAAGLPTLAPASLSAAWADGEAPASAQAHGEGDGLALESVSAGQDGEEVDPAPSASWTAALTFSDNVSYAGDGDAAFVSANLAKVSVMDSAGDPVDCFAVTPASGDEDCQVIYLAATQWLAPCAAYTIVVEPGVADASGQLATTCQYRYTFTTGAQCPDGLTLFQNTLIVVAIVCLAAGVAVVLVRRKRGRR